MFGLGKKQISLGELGEGIAALANEPISTDSARALGMRFENWDASNGWSKFVESKGIPVTTRMLHYRLWTHAAIQTFCTRFDEGKRQAITQSGMGMFTKAIPGYDFGTTYAALEDAFRGNYKFDPKISPLTNPGGGISYLPGSTSALPKREVSDPSVRVPAHAERPGLHQRLRPLQQHPWRIDWHNFKGRGFHWDQVQDLI